MKSPKFLGNWLAALLLLTVLSLSSFQPAFAADSKDKGNRETPPSTVDTSKPVTQPNKEDPTPNSPHKGAITRDDLNSWCRNITINQPSDSAQSFSPTSQPWLAKDGVTANLLKGFELPVRGPGWIITTNPGSDCDHARGQANQHAIDLAPTSQTTDKNLYAPFDGTITVFSNDTVHGLGMRIRIVHSNGYQTDFGHLSSFAVSSGNTVKKGQRIGTVGTSGASTGVHVHWQFQSTLGAWTSLPIYGIPGLQFVNSIQADGLFRPHCVPYPYGKNCDYYGTAVYTQAPVGPTTTLFINYNSYASNKAWNCQSFQPRPGVFYQLRLSPASSDIDLYLFRKSDWYQYGRSTNGGANLEAINWTGNTNDPVMACAYGYQAGNFNLKVYSTE